MSANVTCFGFNVFGSCPRLVVHAPTGSHAALYAQGHALACVEE